MVQRIPALPSMTFDYPDGDGTNRSIPDYIEHIDEVQILNRLIDTDIDPRDIRIYQGEDEFDILIEIHVDEWDVRLRTFSIGSDWYGEVVNNVKCTAQTITIKKNRFYDSICELLTKIEDIKRKALPANIWEWVNTPNFDWDAAQKKLADDLAKQIIMEIDQAIIKDLIETTVTEIILKQQEAEAKLQYLPRNSFYYSERDGPNG
jgi:hypothetical protein